MTKKAKEQILITWRKIEKIRQILNDRMDAYTSSETKEFSDLLEQYQSAVILVGNTIENTLVQECRGDIIPCLEEYCEDIFTLSEAVHAKDEYRRIVIRLREKHRAIEEKINHIETRKMALFLPYKFSMWDSLESIYVAALEDPDFDAVLMPIPYVERTEDEQTKLIYEGPQYYEGYDAVKYQDFDISEQKPDVIYIHNPYDQYNRVTSVASDYYSDVLKQHCEKLVYVPYFFTNSDFPGIHRDLITYNNYDYVIVPSEKARKQVAEFFPGDKVQALGSPKIDRMLLMEKNCVIPKEWENRIRGRKVVLYNISLNAVLQYGFQVILKMNYIFNYFKLHQEVVLWWRPHPLLKSSLKSMRPELYGAYEAMEQMYILDKIGIYDITPDSNRAIAATDGFLGDYSSMCGLYGIVGKPIFLTETISLDEPSDSDRRRFNLTGIACDAIGIVKIGDDIVYYSTDYKALCLLNLNTFETRVLKEFDVMYCKAQAYQVSDPENTEILLFPEDRDHAVISYKVSTGEMREVKEFSGLPLAKYGLIINLGKEWFVSPREETEALFIDKATGEITNSNNLNSELIPFSMLTGDPLLSGCTVQIENKIYTLAYQTGKMLVTDITKRSSELVNIGNGDMHFSGFAYVEGVFVLFEWNGKAICQWDKDTNELKCFTDFPSDYLGMCSSKINPYTPAILGAVYYKENLIILPYLGNMILKFNVKSGSISRYSLDLPYEEGQRRATFYSDRNNYLSLLVYDEHYLLLQTAFDKSFIKLDMETGKTENIVVEIPEALYTKNKESIGSKANRSSNQSPYYIHENGINCSLNDMMSYLENLDGWNPKRQHEASTEGIENADGTCGQKIHDFVKSKLK